MDSSIPSVGALTILAFGLMLGVKHATEIDHVVAVSSIVSQHRSIWRSARVGCLWGLGHTASLLMIGIIVLIFKVAIPDEVSAWFEFLVALMIVLLGMLALFGAISTRRDMHYHRHNHLKKSHIHLHFSENEFDKQNSRSLHSHRVSRVGLKPFIVGSIHGLAGSGALTLLILPQYESAAVSLSYLLIFGFGSVGGMLLMSVIVGLPFALVSQRLMKTHYALQLVASGASVVFGLWYAYHLSVGQP